MARLGRSGLYNPAMGIVVGMLLGLLMGPLTRNLLSPCVRDVPLRSVDGHENVVEGGDKTAFDGHPHVKDFPAPTAKLTDDRKFILIGVMTAKKYVGTRCLAAHRSWATNVPGKVLFFTSEGTELPEHPEVPIIALPGVDDSYPPQKKSFLMLKYMHDRYGDQYEWFMRADDDVFVKGDKMAKFLLSVNSSKPQFMGQAGLGTKEEFGLLSLSEKDNFCMGGPGIVMSRATLKSMAPHISYCLKNLYTTHEDVEVGRCVKKFAGASCTWAFEMQNLFYQNHLEPNGSYTHPLNIKEVHHAITMHPFKNHQYQYRMHAFLWSRKALDLRHKVVELHRETNEMNDILYRKGVAKMTPVNKLGLHPSLMKYKPNSIDDVLTWNFLNGKQIISHLHLNPRRAMDASYKSAVNDILMQVMRMINKNARQRGRTIDFKEILYGYRRINPMFGADYILDLLLVYRKHKGRKMTVPVRRHAYLQQTFTEIVFREEPIPETPSMGSFFGGNIMQMVQNKWSHIYNSNQEENQGPLEFSSYMNRTVHFIMPLAGRFQIFLHFMNNFEEVCLKTNEKVALAVMLFRADVDDRTDDTVAFIEKLKERYPTYDLRVVHLQGPFSRGIGLQEGANLYDDSALLYFVDVDIYISRDSLTRMRFNTILGKQVYFPIVFSQYDPQTICGEKDTACSQGSSPFRFAPDFGYWRQFGYGIAVIHKADLYQAGGFDTSIVGWGKEDVDLYTRVLKSNLTVFRAVDPGMVHIFHPIICDPQLEQAQYRMCLGSRVSTFGSLVRLSHIVYNTPEILHKNDKKEETDDGEQNETNLEDNQQNVGPGDADMAVQNH